MVTTSNQAQRRSTPITIRKVSLYTKTPLQRRLDQFVKTSQANKLVINMPRQTGKTTYLCGLASEICTQNFDELLWYCTPYYKQADQIFNLKLLPMLENSGINYKYNRSKLQVSFPFRRSYIQFRSVENYQGLRGDSLTRLFCDEFAFYRPEVYEQVLSPMMDYKGINTLFASTPKGLNKFHDYKELGEDTNFKDWDYFKGSFYETGNQKQIDNILEKKLYLPPDIFRQEYECEFVSDAGQVFTGIKSIFNADDYGAITERNFCGIDLGKHHDRTVVTILNNKGELIFFKRFELKEQKDATVMIPIIQNILKRFPNTIVDIESNFDPAVYDYLRAENSNIRSVVTTNKSKNELVSNLQFSISHGLVKLPYNNDTMQIEKEMLDYQMQFTMVKREFTYNAPSGGYDDCIISLGTANNLYLKKSDVKNKLRYSKELESSTAE